MRTITEEIAIYKFGEKETPEDVKQKIREYLCDHDHGYWMLEERINTLKAIARVLNANLDYSLSVVPDRGEYIAMRPKYDEIYFQELRDILDSRENCPFTGGCYDEDFKDAFLEAKTDCNIEALNYALDKYVEDIHSEYEAMCTDEYLVDMCEANDYEFTADGKIY